MMLVLVLNSGSSSLKFNLFDMTDETLLLDGMAERIGVDGIFHWNAGKESESRETPIPDHDTALRDVLEVVARIVPKGRHINAVGHRVVHGGPKYGESVLITDEVLADIEAYALYAPLHNPP